MNRRLSASLDIVRWVAALLVVLTHTSNVMLAHIADTPHSQRSPLLYLWVFFEGFGHQSVTIFFVLSGFLVGGRLLERASGVGSIEWGRYMVDRFTRVYLVLVPALLLTFLADCVSFHFTPSRMEHAAAHHTTWPILLGNLANLQTLWAPTFGSNGPIGTLANEFWYYMTFPLLLGVLLVGYSHAKRAIMVAVGVLLLAGMSWNEPTHFLGFLLWALGAAIVYFKKPLTRSPPLATSLAFGVLLGIRLLMRRADSANMWKLFATDVLLSLAFSNLLLTLRFAPDTRAASRSDDEPASWSARMHKKLAGFSFSLYAIHKPLLFAISALTVHYLGFGDVQVATGWRWAVLFGTVAVILAIAYLFSLLTEAHNDAAKEFGYRVFGITWVRRPDGPGKSATDRHPALGQEPSPQALPTESMVGSAREAVTS